MLVLLVDARLNGDFNVEEACRYCKIGLLCTQDSPKLRPSMSTVLDMLIGRTEIDDESISKPGLLFEFLDSRDAEKQRAKAEAENASVFAGSGKEDHSSFSGTINSYATMTFTSIYDRRN